MGANVNPLIISYLNGLFGGGAWVIRAISLKEIFFSLALPALLSWFTSWRGAQLSSTIPSHHIASAVEPCNHWLDPLKLWAKQILSSLNCMCQTFCPNNRKVTRPGSDRNIGVGAQWKAVVDRVWPWALHFILGPSFLSVFLSLSLCVSLSPPPSWTPWSEPHLL